MMNDEYTITGKKKSNCHLLMEQVYKHSAMKNDFDIGCGLRLILFSNGNVSINAKTVSGSTVFSGARCTPEAALASLLLELDEAVDG